MLSRDSVLDFVAILTQETTLLAPQLSRFATAWGDASVHKHHTPSSVGLIFRGTTFHVPVSCFTNTRQSQFNNTIRTLRTASCAVEAIAGRRRCASLGRKPHTRDHTAGTGVQQLCHSLRCRICHMPSHSTHTRTSNRLDCAVGGKEMSATPSSPPLNPPRKHTSTTIA